jgi:hypothetical protein
VQALEQNVSVSWVTLMRKEKVKSYFEVLAFRFNVLIKYLYIYYINYTGAYFVR